MIRVDTSERAYLSRAKVSAMISKKRSREER